MLEEHIVQLFCNRRPRDAGLCPARAIEHAVHDILIALFELDDALTDLLCRLLCADIWLAAPAVQLSVAVHIAVIINRPPQAGVRMRAAPVHRAEAHPRAWYLKRLDDVKITAPGLEELSSGKAPIA